MVTVKNKTERTFITPDGVLLPHGELEMGAAQAERHLALYPDELEVVGKAKAAKAEEAKEVVEQPVEAEPEVADEGDVAEFDVVTADAPKKRGRPAKTAE